MANAKYTRVSIRLRAKGPHVVALDSILDNGDILHGVAPAEGPEDVRQAVLKHAENIKSFDPVEMAAVRRLAIDALYTHSGEQADK